MHLREGELTGSCSSDQGPLPITGKVDGKTVTWQYPSQWEGQPLTVVFTGTLESSEKITGTIDVEPLGVSGTFSAVPVR